MNSDELLKMQPMELISVLNAEVHFSSMPSLDDEAAYATANELLNQATAYICYFKQMETAARIRKREAKRNKEDAAEIDRCMGVEEVFETFKRIAEQQFELVTKSFTSKRLVLEEFKQQSKMT